MTQHFDHNPSVSEKCNYLRQGGYPFAGTGLFVFVCLSVSLLATLLNKLLMGFEEISRKVRNNSIFSLSQELGILKS